MIFQPPPPPPLPVFTIDWVSAAQDFPLYRSPWEARKVRQLPRKLAVSYPRLSPAPIRVGLHRQYWFGPVSDFFLFMGFLTLGGGYHDPRGSSWVVEPRFEVELGTAPPVFNPGFQFRLSAWENYTPLRATLLGDGGGAKPR